MLQQDAKAVEKYFISNPYQVQIKIKSGSPYKEQTYNTIFIVRVLKRSLLIYDLRATFGLDRYPFIPADVSLVAY